jgi:transposase-like protein
MKKSCYFCGKTGVKKFGKTKQFKQRYRCLSCLRTYIWKSPINKRGNGRKWFRDWVKEGYSIRQLSVISNTAVID